jgi:hypothetical protein
MARKIRRDIRICQWSRHSRSSNCSGAFLATLDSSTGRFNFNGFDLGKAADYAVAHEAVLAGAGESRLQVGASCIRMACGGVVGALVQVATGERTVLVGDRAVDPSLLGLASAMILAP